MSEAVMSTDLPFPKRSGKVRDVYDLGDSLLIVATDRISAFDVIMPNGIPDKGKILTALSVFWFNKFKAEFENHILATDVREYPAALRGFSALLEGRSMLCKKARVIPIECVARGYITGSGWKEYVATGQTGGHHLPPGLRQCDKLPQPIFTPATKEESGHDINIDYAEAAKRVGESAGSEIRDRTLSLYMQAADYARQRGIIIADTKFEFGQLPDGRIILIDEILTPDSSRFWPADAYDPGHDQPSYDKQFLRNWLEKQPWNKTAPAPALPAEVVEGTRKRYLEAYERITGSVLVPGE
jgi:phosphoribosylaminoimidazole-succinocarboxamide synthase